MSESSENRSHQGRFKKGVSGNPGGRPKGLQGFREWLEGTREQRQSALIQLLASEDERVRLEALKHADAYDYGKPSQPVTGEDGGPLQVLIMKLPPERP
jgi:hypothetical protein